MFNSLGITVLLWKGLKQLDLIKIMVPTKSNDILLTALFARTEQTVHALLSEYLRSQDSRNAPTGVYNEFLS